MFYLVSYDIPDTKRRTKLAKVLEDFGDRVQFSVFECILDDKLLDKLVKRIDKIVKVADDSVRIYTVCANCERCIRIIGQGVVSKIEEIYIV
ncbi:MAG: CRISPR-associated endonuclease Cas2 [Candidatus Scalindua sp.]|nr:CRISPR-associated endonuclease Cas2 [Candidatus Scalindua sp.]